MKLGEETKHGICKEDVRTVTGCNLRNILLLTRAPNIDVLKKNDVRNLVYREADDNDSWRINLAKEIFEMRNGITDPIPGWKKEELDDLFNFACV